jgi:hypothetical protein
VSLPVRIAERQGPPGRSARFDADDVTQLDLLGGWAAARSVRYEVTVQGTQTAADKAVWPYGLVANLLLGVSGVALTTRCLKAPYARLPKAVRVA